MKNLSIDIETYSPVNLGKSGVYRYGRHPQLGTWPVSSRQSEAVRRSIVQQADPLTKPGVVGAFCRAYTIEEAIETFLSDVYTPSAMNGRFDYIPADSSAGVVVYDGKFSYVRWPTVPFTQRTSVSFASMTESWMLWRTSSKLPMGSPFWLATGSNTIWNESVIV